MQDIHGILTFLIMRMSGIVEPGIVSMPATRCHMDLARKLHRLSNPTIRFRPILAWKSAAQNCATCRPDKNLCNSCPGGRFALPFVRHQLGQFGHLLCQQAQHIIQRDDAHQATLAVHHRHAPHALVSHVA
jgi:hypothetical protein